MQLESQCRLQETSNLSIKNQGKEKYLAIKPINISYLEVLLYNMRWLKETSDVYLGSKEYLQGQGL